MLEHTLSAEGHPLAGVIHWRNVPKAVETHALTHRWLMGNDRLAASARRLLGAGSTDSAQNFAEAALFRDERFTGLSKFFREMAAKGHARGDVVYTLSRIRHEGFLSPDWHTYLAGATESTPGNRPAAEEAGDYRGGHSINPAQRFADPPEPVGHPVRSARKVRYASFPGAGTPTVTVRVPVPTPISPPAPRPTYRPGRSSDGQLPKSGTDNGQNVTQQAAFVPAKYAVPRSLIIPYAFRPRATYRPKGPAVPMRRKYARGIEPHPLFARDGVNPHLSHLLTSIAAAEERYPESGEIATVILAGGHTDLLPQLGVALKREGHPDAGTVRWKHAPRAVATDHAMLHTHVMSGTSHYDNRVALFRHLTPFMQMVTAGDPAGDTRRSGRMSAEAKRAVPDATDREIAASFARLRSRADLLHRDMNSNWWADNNHRTGATHPGARMMEQSPVALPTEIRTSRPRDPRRMARRAK
jgi:hypothetical protein